MAGAEWVTEGRTGSRRKEKKEVEKDGGDDKQQKTVEPRLGN